jgi:hypothetical protein
MKFVYSILVMALLLLAGCKQDFQTTVPKYVDTPVVYGLLAMSDYGNDGNTHYIRIQKGYLLKGNAYLATGIEDSIYYPDNLTVQLISSNGFSVYDLTRIDGATVGLNKDTGIFANVPNYLYTFHQFLDSTRNYTLLITRNSGADTVAYANTSLVNTLTIYSPSNLGNSTIAFSNANPATITWAAAQNSGSYDLTVRFFYREYITATNTLTKDTFIDIPVFRSYIPGTTTGNITYTFTSSIVLSYMAQNIAHDPTVYREFNNMQFNFAAGGTALTSYFVSQQAQSGLTSSNALPPYTNITNGVGLFSSREYQSVSGIFLTNEGLDSLACDPTASVLNFKNSSGNVCH